MTNLDSETVVSVQHDGPVTHIKLNRPDKLNAFNSSLVEQCIGGVEEATNNGARLLVISGEGRAFSAGFDLSNLDDQSDADLVLRFIRIEMFLQAIQSAPMATLALVHGRCFGAAADVFCVCDKRIATPDATFRMPGLQFGIVLGTRRLAALAGRKNAQSVLETSKVFTADDALEKGIAQQLVAAEDWHDVIALQTENAMRLTPDAQVRMLSNTRTQSNDADLAELVRSASRPGLAQRIKDFIGKPKAEK